MILEYFGERTLLKGLGVLQRYVNDPRNQLTEQSVKLFNLILTRLQSIIPLLVLSHKGFFYISGRYYSLGKRLTKIDYAKVNLLLFFFFKVYYITIIVKYERITI